MLSENGATRLNVVPNRSSAQDDPFLAAVKEAAAADFTVLGEIGRGEGGVIMYLARETSSRRLVALRLQREGQLADEFSLEIVRHLDNSMPAPDSKCVKCGKAIKGWARFCSFCGADLTGAAPKEGDAVERALMLEAVKEAVSAEYDVLGEMSRTEGGGAVYFALDRNTKHIVALRLQREGEGDEFSVGLTTALKPIARSLGVRTAPTQALSAMPQAPPAAPPVSPPSSAASAAPPPPLLPPPLPPARPGLTTQARVMLGGLLAVVVATAVIVATLPHSAAAPTPPGPLVAPDTAAPAVAAPAPAHDSTIGAKQGVTPPVAARPATDTAAAPSTTPRRQPVAVVAPRQDATLRITGLPAAAEIRVDDRIRVGRTLTVPAGRHVLAVSVAGYVPRTDTMLFRAGETMTWSPALTPEPAKPVATAPRPAAPAGPACAASVQGEQWAAAFESCMRESLAGSAAARRNLAQLYERGHGVTRSEESATRWYESAASGGDREAMYQLAMRYERGRGVKKDPALAVQWYTKAGDAGLLPAQLVLAEIYEKGRLGVAKDKARALEWYRKAAAQGNKAAADKVRDLSKP
jgi:hypothetical protein